MEILKNWQEEKRSAYLYQTLASSESKPEHKKLFLNLASMAERQAVLWEKQLQTAKIAIPTHYHPDLRTRIIASLSRCLGAKAMRLPLAAMKVRGMSVYR